MKEKFYSSCELISVRWQILHVEIEVQLYIHKYCDIKDMN